jgi:hypothetical protein
MKNITNSDFTNSKLISTNMYPKNLRNSNKIATNYLQIKRNLSCLNSWPIESKCKISRERYNVKQIFNQKSLEEATNHYPFIKFIGHRIINMESKSNFEKKMIGVILTFSEKKKMFFLIILGNKLVWINFIDVIYNVKFISRLRLFTNVINEKKEDNTKNQKCYTSNIATRHIFTSSKSRSICKTDFLICYSVRAGISKRNMIIILANSYLKSPLLTFVMMIRKSKYFRLENDIKLTISKSLSFSSLGEWLIEKCCYKEKYEQYQSHNILENCFLNKKNIFDLEINSFRKIYKINSKFAPHEKKKTHKFGLDAYQTLQSNNLRIIQNNNQNFTKNKSKNKINKIFEGAGFSIKIIEEIITDISTDFLRKKIYRSHRPTLGWSKQT